MPGLIPLPGTYRFVLAPWEYGPPSEGSEDCWHSPAGAVSSLDLRPLPAQALKSTAEGSGFFALDPAADVPAGGIDLGVDLAAPLPRGEREVAVNMLELSAGDLGGPSLLADLVMLLTDLSEASGSNRVRALMPGRDRMMRLRLPGLGTLWSQRFSPVTHRKVIDAVRHDLAARASSGKVSDLAIARALAVKARKLQVLPRELLAPRGGATVSSSFDQADSSTVGPGTWTEVAGAWATLSNTLRVTLNGLSTIRNEAGLDSDDMYVQITPTTLPDFKDCGACSRFADAANTCMIGTADNQNSTSFGIYKNVAGTPTLLAGLDNQFPVAAGSVLRFESDGSTHEVSYGGVSKVGPTTDTSISGNTKAGVFTSDSETRMDDFEAGDLNVVVATGPNASVLKHLLGV